MQTKTERHLETAEPLDSGGCARAASAWPRSARPATAILLALFFLAAFTAEAGADAQATQRATEPVIVERGSFHRIWQSLRYQTNLDGSIIVATNAYTELADGICYPDPQDPASWLDSQEMINIVNGFGVATQGQWHVIFEPNIHTYGAIDAVTPDGKRLQSQPIGLAFTDGTGKSVLIAEVKDSIGKLVQQNQVLFQDAFSDGVKADIKVHIQTILIRARCSNPVPIACARGIWFGC